jgi:DNA (cytosine-5)-methyltransferase 1
MLDERGQIIFGLVKILRERNVPFFILENVKGLVNHERGETMTRVVELLEEANYKVSYRVLNSIDFGVPQLRERIYFVGIRNDISTSSSEFEWPTSVEGPPLENFFERNPRYLIEPLSQTFNTFLRYLKNRYNAGRFDLAEILREDDLVLDTRQSDLRLYRGRVPTLRTGRHGIYYVSSGGLFRLSPSEAFRLQGFPEELSVRLEGCNSGTSLLSQAGNAMTVNVIEAIAKSLIRSVLPS